MRRRKVAPWVVAVIGAGALVFFVLVEIAKRDKGASWNIDSLWFEVPSKVFLALGTGSFFFLITEAFRNVKRKEEKADATVAFLERMSDLYNGLIDSFLPASRLYHWGKVDHIHVTSLAELKEILSNWTHVTGMKFKRPDDNWDAAVLVRIGMLLQNLRKNQTNFEGRQALFSLPFVEAVNATLSEGESLAQNPLSQPYPLDIAVGILDTLKKLRVQLENIYRAENNLPLLDPVKP